MKKITLLILISIFVIACTSNTIYKKPNNLIPRDQMIDLLVDMQIALGAKEAKNSDGNRMVEYMPLVYQKHGIDSAQFAESTFYYTTDIDKYHDIIKEVKNRLDTLRVRYETLSEEKDSIKRAANPKNKKKPEVSRDSIVK